MEPDEIGVAGVALAERASRLRVAIVHEWLTNWAGSERCVEALRRAFPEGRTYTSVVDETTFADWAGDVRASHLQHLPFLRTRHALALPLLPLAMSRVRIGDSTDLVIRSFHSFATMPRQPSGVPEIVYCHAPRFIYGRGTLRGESRRIRAAAWVAGAAMARSDKERVRRVTAVVANSRHTARRVSAIYGVEAQVIHPPVNLDRFTPLTAESRDDYFMMGGRLVAYKRPEMAIEAFRRLPHERLVVVGDGRQRRTLEGGAPSNVTFVGAVDDRRYELLLSRAKGFVFPGEDDFGIAPVEALAAGVPVAALGRGGALDYIQDGVNGLRVPSPTPAALRSTVQEMAATRWDPASVSATALPFAEPVFVRRMQEVAMAVTEG